MSSLTTCIKKAGDYLSPVDKSAILKKAQELRRQGVSANDAAMQAVDAQIALVTGLLEAKGLSAPTRQDVLDQQDRSENAAKEKAAAGRAAEKQAAEADDRKRIAQASEAAADTFELGGDAMANLTGQKDIFAEEPVGKQGPAKIEDIGEKIGGARKDTAVSTGFKRKSATDEDERPTWAKRFQIAQVAGGFDASVNGRDITGKWTIRDLRTKDRFDQPKRMGDYFNSREEAEAALPLIAVAQKHRVSSTGQKNADGGYTYEIWRDVNDRKRVKVVDREFQTREEAMKYMAQNAKEILETNTTFGEADLPKPENTGRIGVERRTGDVKGEDFRDAFGFRGVEFGLWNNQDERQEVMNAAYDGLMDLAEVLKVPPKAIGLNGDLALAFGARGKGLSGARAHYETDRVVMNLTKMNGAGALAHEWFHALDHYLARQDGKTTADWKINKDGTRSLDVRGGDADMASSGFLRNNSGVREELRTAYTSLVQSLFTKAEQYVEDTARADKFVSVARGELEKDLADLRKDLSEQKDVRYYKRNNKPASAEQLAEFDAMAAELVEGRGLATEWKSMPGKSRLAIQTRHTNETLEKLNELYKDVRGRSGFNAERRGVLDALSGYMKRYDQRLQMLREATALTTKTKRVPTSFAMDAKSLDQGRGGDYWTSPHEMVARAFQGYVEDAIAVKDGRSPFLNYAPENAGILTPWGAKRPYPAGAERKAMNSEFDKFIDVLETKETDKGVAMFALGADAFRLGITPRKFMPVADIQKTVDQLTAKWKDGPKIKVVQFPDELPVDAPSDARGLIHKGIAYVVAVNHLDRAGVARTLAHEAIGHYGLWKMLGTEGTRQFERNVQLALKSGNKPLNAIAARVRKLYVDDAGKFNLSPAQEANEIAAFAVEEALDADGNFNPGFGFFKQAWAKVADFLRGLGFDIKFTNAELQGMLVSSMRGLEAGQRLEGGGETLVAAARDGRNVFDTVASVWEKMANSDDLFKHQKSGSTDLGEVTRTVDQDLKVGEPIANNGTFVYSVRDTLNPDGVALVSVDGDKITLDISNWQQGDGGSRVYAAVANWAYNTGKVFHEDAALSGNSIYRRTENMLSTALKFKTTRHIAPGKYLLGGNEELGVAPLSWTTGDDEANIRSLIETSYNNVITQLPILRDVRFDFAGNKFVRADGTEVTGDRIKAVASTADARRAKAGEATIKRTLVTESILRAMHHPRRGEGVNTVLGQLDGLNGDWLQTVSARELPEALQRVGYARGGQGTGAGLTPGLFAPTVWNTPDPTRTDRIIYELQDGRVDLKRIQQAIEKSGQQIVEKWDARLAETLYPGRVAHRSKQFLDAEVKPLLKAMATYGVQMDELADYLHARGAEERNAQIAKVNPALPDGGAGKNTKGVLLTNQAARDYLAGISPVRKQLMDVLSAKVDAITDGTRSLLVGEGLEKQETIDAWTKTYKNYVPMFRDEAQSGAPHPQGSGFSVKGSASKRATGSTKEVTNILAHVLMQREAAITRAEKNRVALALYGQALSHPNPDFWTTIKPSMTAAKIGAELQRMGVDPMTAAAGMETVPTITTVDQATGKKVERPNPLYRSLPGAIPLKVNGEDRVLMLNVENERGARLAENLKNLDGLTAIDWSVGLLHKFVWSRIPANVGVGPATRWLASVNTQYNPAFGLVNLTRDTLGAAINLGSTELRGNALKVLAKTPVAIVGIARELAQGGKSGKWQSLYRQFQEDGGQTGWKENFRDAGDRAKAIESELAGLQKAGKLTAIPGRVAHALLDLLDGFNTTLENAVRVSAYAAALDSGMSRAEAARLGRELTVDFNRKGRVGREAGPLYAFFNASVQGSARTLETLKGPTGAKVIAGGLGLGALQVLMLLAAGYDDDEVPEFVKTRALVIPLNWTGKGEKTHVLVPYPLGLHVIPNTGRVVSELVLNGGKNIGKRSGEAIGELAGAFNPLGGGNIFTTDGALKTIAPTLLDPVIELGYNRNFAGNSIEREAFNGETDTRPGVARAKEATQRSTTGQAYMGISKAINAMTGGNDYEAGAASPTPERIRYLAQTVGGGVLREIEKTINASTAASRGEDVKSSAIPVLGRFYGEVDDNQVKTSRYFENAKRLDKLENTKKTIIKSGDAEAMAKLLEDSPEIALISLGNKVQSSVAKLNKMAIQTIDDRESLKQIDETRVQIMDQLNQALAGMEDEAKAQTPAAKLKGWRKEAVN
jgi:hypothetical protein